MWFPKSLSALWLASCVMAAGDTMTTKLSEDGIRSIPVCLLDDRTTVERKVD